MADTAGMLDEEYSLLLKSLYQEPSERIQNLARLKLLTESFAESYADNAELRVLLRHLPTLLRLSIDCPYENIRTTCQEILDIFRKCEGVEVPEAIMTSPSSFMAVEPNAGDEEVQREFCEAYDIDGRVSHMTRVLAYHPKFLAKFRDTHHVLLWGEGPLPLEYRQIIAVMAASRHQCTYLMDIHSQEFLELHGNPQWLLGAEFLAPKLKNLLPLNCLLAHQPWLITTADIASLIKGEDSWSISELVHAIVIMSAFHSLPGFIFGCGITPEVDQPGGHFVGIQANPPCPIDLAAMEASLADALFDETSTIISVMKKKKNDDEANDSEANFRSYQAIETEASNCPQQQQITGLALYSAVSIPGVRVGIPEGHVDFDIRTENYSVLRTQHFSWTDHCYDLLSRYYAAIAEPLDAEFKMIKELTYDFMGKETGIETFQYRWAIWNYQFRIKGVANDEYLYGQINDLIQIPLKTYIKTVSCYPQLTTRLQYLTFNSLKDSEKVHINLLTIESRFQAELMYALRAVMKFMS